MNHYLYRKPRRCVCLSSYFIMLYYADYAVLSQIWQDNYNVVIEYYGAYVITLL
jgi:hypothetical protein